MKTSESANASELLVVTTGLLQASRFADAAKTLRRALDLAPLDPPVAAAVSRVTALARQWLMLGQAAAAATSLAPLAGSPNASGDVLMLYGHSLMLLGRKGDAAAVLRRCHETAPDDQGAALRLAAVLADGDQPGEAEALVRASIARRGETPEAVFVLGRALLRLARFDEAEAAFRKVVHANAAHQTAHANLMELVWMRTGDVHAASRVIDRALRAQPQLSGLRIAKARLLLSARLPREALVEIDVGLAASPTDPALLHGAATIALEFDGARALDYARRLLVVAPDDRMARVAMGNASLATGQPQAALEMADALHRLDPTDGQALAMQVDALRMLGDGGRRCLADYGTLVRADFIDVPMGWATLDAYLVDLVDALRSLHRFRAHPIGNSLRDDSQIELLPENSGFPAIRAFPQAIDRSIRRYINALGHGGDPMRSRNTGRYRLAGMWSVRLRPHGFHVNHYHPEGWISSACYLQVPPAVSGRGGEGWLKFGEPAFATRPHLSPEFFLKPEAGLLALFPSYLWHGTVPFSGGENDTRLTIAFDVVPA